MNYNELVTLTKKYLLEEYGNQEWILTDKETYLWCRNLAVAEKPSETPKSKIIPKKVEPPPPIPAAPPPPPKDDFNDFKTLFSSKFPDFLIKP